MIHPIRVSSKGTVNNCSGRVRASIDIGTMRYDYSTQTYLIWNGVNWNIAELPR